MAGLWNIPYWSLTLLQVIFVCLCWGCTPPDGAYDPPKIEEKIYYSDLIAYGKVLDIIEGGYMYDSMHTVNFEVYCTYKGDVLPRVINITRAGKNVSPGYEPGLCISTDFIRNNSYLVFLNEDLTPRYMEDSDPYGQIASDMEIYCNLVFNYPKGVTADTAEYECVEPDIYYDECMEYTPTTPSTEDVVVKTMAPKPEDGDNMPADGTSQGTEGEPEPDNAKPEPGEAVSLEDGETGTGMRAVTSLGLTALCLAISLL